MKHLTYSFILLITLLNSSYVYAADCGLFGEMIGLCKLAEELNNSTKELSKAVDQAVEAVPGERYLRMIDAINDPKTPKDVKERYQTLARNLFSVSPATNYQVNIGFGIESSNNIEAAFFYSNSGLESSVQSWCNSQITYQPTQVSNTLTKLLTPKQRDELIDKQLQLAIRTLGSAVDNVKHKSKAGMPSVINYTTFRVTKTSALSPALTNHYTQTDVNGHLSKSDIEQQSRRNGAVKHLRNAMNAYYGEPGKMVIDRSLVRDYQPYIDKPYLVVTIAEKHIHDLTDNFNVKAIVYAKDVSGNTSNQALDDMWPIKLGKKDFMANKLVSCGNPSTNIRWAVAPLLRDTILSADLVRAITETKALLKRYENELSNP